MAWPKEPLLGEFYKTYISGRSYEHRYAHLRDLDPDNLTHTEKVAAEELIKNNFLSLYAIADEQVMIEYVQSPKLSPVSYISQLGGALNLWAGITVIIVVEFLELIVDVLCKREKDSTKITALKWWRYIRSLQLAMQSCWNCDIGTQSSCWSHRHSLD